MEMLNHEFVHVSGDIIKVNAILPGTNKGRNCEYCLCEITKQNGKVITQYVISSNQISLMLLNHEIFSEEVAQYIKENPINVNYEYNF